MATAASASVLRLRAVPRRSVERLCSLVPVSATLMVLAFPFLLLFFCSQICVHSYQLACPCRLSRPEMAAPATFCVTKSASTDQSSCARRSEEHTSELQSPDHL